jgi:hypothetical protein
MRKLIVIALIGAALWSGYWFVGNSTKSQVLEGWLAERRTAGWTADYSDFRVVGFPNRFDSRFTDLDLYDPVSGIGWQAPLFHILALSYQPNHIIAAFPNSQTLTFPQDQIAITSTQMQASVTFEPDTLLAVDETLLRSSNVTLTSGRGWRSTAEKFNLSTRQSLGQPFAHDIVFDAKNVTPTEAFRQGLDPKGRLPSLIETLFLDMQLGFNAPWDRVAIETGAPEVTTLGLNRMNITWGLLGLNASGMLDVAENGVLSGELALEVVNWREVLELLATSGVLDAGTVFAIIGGVGILNAGAEDPTRLKAALVINDGNMFLGPIALGAAPRFIRDGA